MLDQAVLIMAATMFTVIGAVWSLALWITRQFSSIKSLIYEQAGKNLERIESHERHDNTRFAAISDHLWQLRLDAKGYGSNPRKEEELNKL